MARITPIFTKGDKPTSLRPSMLFEKFRKANVQ